MPGVFPDYPAPVVRNAGTERELTMMRWGMPPPPRTGGPPVTNIRNTSSPHWRGWLKAENRCLVPANSFAEYAAEPNPEPRSLTVSRLLLAIKCNADVNPLRLLWERLLSRMPLKTSASTRQGRAFCARSRRVSLRAIFRAPLL
jgi:hypothetical protein